MRYTEKRNGKNVIPLRNAVCGVELPHWSIDKQSDIQSFLSGDAVDRLAEYEDKIEQGTLIELPCKVGDTVYEVNTVSRTVSTSKARNLGIILRWKEDDLFGRWLFLTREEAEKRLKELQE